MRRLFTPHTKGNVVVPLGSVADRLNRLPITSKHRWATAIVGLGFFFDLFEIFLGSILAVVLEKEFKVGHEELPALLGSMYIGAFIGAFFVSRLGDRYGRRTAFLLTLGIYSAFSLLGAFSVNLEMLIATRFIAGIGIGAELPLGSAYLADLVPARVRGRFIAIAFTIGFCGIPAVGFLGKFLMPLAPLGVDGWRWLMVAGSLGAVIIWFLRRSLPESPRWLEVQGRGEKAEATISGLEELARREHGDLPDVVDVHRPSVATKVPVRELFTGPWRRRTVMLWVFHSVQTFGYYGFGTLVPLVLTEKGYSVTSSLTYTALSFIGYPLGSALSIPVMERIDRKWIIVASAGGMVVLGLAFAAGTSPFWITVFGLLYTMMSNLFSNALHAYQVELYPTNIRATAAGSAYSLSRLTTALMPFVLVPLLHGQGPGAVFTVVVAAMCVVMADVAFLGPRTTGLSLERINDAERSTQAEAEPKKDVPS